MNTQKGVGKVGKCKSCLRKEHLSSHAGTVRLHDFAPRWGVARLLDEELRGKGRERGYGEGHAMGGLGYNLIGGGEPWSDLEVWRGDPGTQEVLAAETILAPTTAGECLRKGAIGAVHDWARVQRRLPPHGRPHQQAPTCTSDLDSSLSEQAASAKAGATTADNGESGSHPWLAFWAEEGEWLLSPLRRGSAPTARKGRWFLRQTRQRLPAPAGKKLRADSGCYRKAGVEWGAAAGGPLTLTADQTAPLRAALTARPERRWRNVPAYASQVPQFL